MCSRELLLKGRGLNTSFVDTDNASQYYETAANLGDTGMLAVHFWTTPVESKLTSSSFVVYRRDERSRMVLS